MRPGRTCSATVVTRQLSSSCGMMRWTRTRPALLGRSKAATTTTTRVRARTTTRGDDEVGTTTTTTTTTSTRNLGLPFSTGAALEGVTKTVIEASKGTEDVRIDGPEAAGKTLVYIDETREGVIDREDGLPAVYDRMAIQKYWDGRPGELRKRWGEFVRLNVPFLTRVGGILLSGNTLQSESGALSKQAREIMETLGPTYIKMGQMLSVRPDILPEEAREELAVLQDSVKPFSASTASEVVERSLGLPISEVFSEFSEKPVAAASLAQVHRATLKSTGQVVAVKVQRPNIIETVSKDLYVLRRAAEVYQSIMDRFAPQQRTSYVALLNEWAVGFYTELDFMNEAANQIKMRNMLEESNVKDVYIPEVFTDYCSRYVLVTEWVDGKKLTECDPEEVRELVAIGQECFLTQLLQLGFFHCDPHPGNLMKLSDPAKGKLALIDFGLMASLSQEEMDTLVSSIVHLSNKDYQKLTEDFVELGILPTDCDRQKVLPLMDKALSPFIKGGGATKYKDEIMKTYEGAGGLQSMTSDFVTVMNDIPFSIPPYFALLGRAVATLEGIALIGNPNYRIVMESYPFVSRKLLSDDRPAFQQALTEILYSKDQTLKSQRLAVLLNSAQGIVAETDSFVDLDAIPENSMNTVESVQFFFGEEAFGLRNTLQPEITNAADFLLRQAIRRVSTQVEIAAPRLPFLPPPESVPVPFVTFGANGMPQPALLPLSKATAILAPPLTQDEEIYALSMLDLANDLSGLDVKGLFMDPFETVRALVSGGRLDGALFGNDLLSLELQGEDRARAEAFATEILNQLSERYTARLTGVV
ncbi:putative UbiB-like protein kinase [Chloropicon primus]|nr:putative UbiB-like protein kinase [Chloropicon primus]